MIRRGYPKYLSIADFAGIDAKSPAADKNELFFNLGRSAIKFTLQVLSAYFGRHLTAAAQSLNCSTVMDAILESGCTAVLSDVKLEDFSINFNELITMKKPDVLILTHYQGVPNLQYLQIAEYCRENHIFLMEDICQTEYSRINNIEVGELADVSVHAFSLDKPFCCYTGGSLYLNRVSEEIKQLLLNKYYELPMEPAASAALDLAVLKYLLVLFAGGSYRPELDHTELIRSLKKLGISEKFIPGLTASQLVQRLYSLKTRTKAWIFKPQIAVTRLDPVKQNLILWQRQKFDWDKNQRLTEVLEKWLISKEFTVPDYPGAAINWNRYSLYDPSGRLKRELKALDIEAGNFNWPVSMNRLYRGVPKVVMENSYVNTELLCEHIVNIPVWCDLSEKFAENQKTVK